MWTKQVRLIPIYHKSNMPNMDGFIEMDGWAIDAYPYQHDTGVRGDGDFSQEARELAIRTVASYFCITTQAACDQFEICIVPAAGFHGKIMARQKKSFLN